jgi:hypothetical protein
VKGASRQNAYSSCEGDESQACPNALGALQAGPKDNLSGAPPTRSKSRDVHLDAAFNTTSPANNTNNGAMRVATRSLPAAYRHLASPRHTQRYFTTTVTLWHHAPEVVQLKVGGSGHVLLEYILPCPEPLLQYLTALQHF